LNRRVLLDKLAQNSKRKYGRPAKYREKKDGKRKIKFDKSFVQRALHARYQHWCHSRDFKSTDAKTLDFYLLKPRESRFPVLGNLQNMLYLKSRNDDDDNGKKYVFCNPLVRVTHTFHARQLNMSLADINFMHIL